MSHEDDGKVYTIATITSIINLNFDFSSFPLSYYSKNHNLCHLSYEAKEISCHSQEVYVERLTANNYSNLMIHCYRAAIEKIISKHWPQLKHAALKSIKHSAVLTFPDYCSRATSHLNIVIPMSDILAADVQNDLICWKKVVIFYTLRLVLASLVESVILYDRMLSVLEKGKTERRSGKRRNLRNVSFSDHCVHLEAIFDPFVSARNIVMTATRKDWLAYISVIDNVLNIRSILQLITLCHFLDSL